MVRMGTSQSVIRSILRSQAPIIEFRKYGMGEKTPRSLLDDFASCESWSDRIDFDLHTVSRFGLWDENYETLDPCDSVTATASLLDVKLVLLAFLNWLLEGTLIAHAFHLVQCVQLVLRRKT